MIKNIRIELMRLFYNDCNLSHDIKACDEMEAFFDALKMLDTFTVDQTKNYFDKIRESVSNVEALAPVKRPRGGCDLLNILQTMGLESLCYENITIEVVKALQANDKITKALALQLAEKIGITKKSYKTRKDIFYDIVRMINNRDTMNATKNALTNEIPNIDE